MQIVITLSDQTIAGFSERLKATPAKVKTELGRGLQDGGRKLMTQVRRALKEQMNVRRYGVIVQGSKGILNRGALSYTIAGYGKGLPIREFSTRVTGKGVWSDPWGNGRVFARSFQQRRKGGLVARRGPDRFPLQSLRGPSLAKELVKGQSLDTWQSGVAAFVAPAIVKRLRKLLP